MIVQHILSKKGTDVVSVDADAPVLVAVRVLSGHNIGAVLVLDGEDDLAGILSERDLVHNLSANQGEVLTKEVREIMSRDLVTCRPDDPIERAMQIMSRHKVRHLPVKSNDRLRGIISIGDLLKARVEEKQMETAILRNRILGRDE